MWIKANPNPKGKLGTDCVIRAISICLKIDWYGYALFRAI